ncbi:hypothetical protein EMIHUDRAFT_253522, partial [Emiliania huxleyi CCMP1516]|uniref:Uncharacterized protein n=2 Tax=Emiliania huxleyi TaxID=2903 RepID=A0A0D3K6X6_EMIH1
MFMTATFFFPLSPRQAAKGALAAAVAPSQHLFRDSCFLPVNKWKKEMRSESRKLDRQILKIQREEEKIKRSVKEAAKRGDTASCKTYAKEIVRSRKAVTRLHTSKAQMNSVVMQMQNQMSQAK